MINANTLADFCGLKISLNEDIESKVPLLFWSKEMSKLVLEPPSVSEAAEPERSKIQRTKVPQTSGINYVERIFSLHEDRIQIYFGFSTKNLLHIFDPRH